MFKFVMATILIVSIRALAADQLVYTKAQKPMDGMKRIELSDSPGSLLTDSFKTLDKGLQVQAYNYLRAANLAKDAEKGKYASVTDEKIKSAFNVCRKDDLPERCLKLTTTTFSQYSSLVRNGSPTGEDTLAQAARSAVKIHSLGITESALDKEVALFKTKNTVLFKDEQLRINVDLIHLSRKAE